MDHRPFLLALTIATASVAQMPAEQAPAADAAEKPVCRRVPQTGTRFTKRVCRPAAEWQALDHRTVNGEGFAGLSAGGRTVDTGRFGPAGKL